MLVLDVGWVGGRASVMSAVGLVPLGKESDRVGPTVIQGIAVSGKKASADQHAYVQQLRDGVRNLFVTFINMRKSTAGTPCLLEPRITQETAFIGFLRGSRAALYEGWRDSVTVSLLEVSPKQIGGLIALYARAVGFHAPLMQSNACHNPGVNAGKKAATAGPRLQCSVRQMFAGDGSTEQTAADIAFLVKAAAESVHRVLIHLLANDPSVVITAKGGLETDIFCVA